MALKHLQSIAPFPNLERRRRTLNLTAKNGQVMLLTVIVLSGTLLSVTIIAGLLMLFQIRQAGDFINSSKAFFAADAGLNWWVCSEKGFCVGTPSSSMVFGNNASFEVLPAGSGFTKVIGQAGNSKRALLLESLTGPCLAPDIILAPEANGLVDLAIYRPALKSFFNDINASSSETYLGLKEFGTLAVVGQILRHVTSTITGLPYLQSGIDSLSGGGAGVNLADAIQVSQDELDSATYLNHPPDHERDDATHPDFLIIIVSDGLTLPTRPGFTTVQALAAAENIATLAKASGTTIFVVGTNVLGAAYKTSLQNIASPGGYFDATDYTANLKDTLIKLVLPQILAGC